MNTRYKHLHCSNHVRAWLCAIGMLLFSVPANAGDPLVEGGRLCTQQFPIQEQKYHIPTHLLAAISTTESGRWHKGLGMAVPWPWTINVDGKGYYFSSKAEVITQTQNLIAQGKRSIDVGCMQVNLKHHSKAFKNLDEAFDPEINVAYAARFLRDNYADLGDWIKATAAYHSRTQVYGQRYLVQIERSWNSIVAKVAAARASQASGVPMTPTTSRQMSKTATTAKQVSAPQSVKNIQAARHERVIKVTDSPHRGSEILVIRGATTSVEKPVREPVQAMPIQGTAAAVGERAQQPISTPAGDSVRRVTLDNQGGGAQPVPSTFVFN